MVFGEDRQNQLPDIWRIGAGGEVAGVLRDAGLLLRLDRQPLRLQRHPEVDPKL